MSYMTEGLQHDGKSLHSFYNLVLTKAKGWLYQLLKHSTGTQGACHSLQKPLWDHTAVKNRDIFFIPTHSYIPSSASWPWAVGKLQLLIENCAEGRFLSYHQAALPSLRLHYMGRAGTGAGEVHITKGCEEVLPSFRSTWVIPTVPTQYEFRLFQVTQNW